MTASSAVGRPRGGVKVLFRFYFLFLTGLNRYMRIKYSDGSCNVTQTAVLARYAMMYSVLTLLLAAVLLADMASATESSRPLAGHTRVKARGDGPGVAWFVCAHCTATGQLSSRGLFLNRAAVRRHISASKPCFSSWLGFWEIAVEACPSDSMAGGGGGAGPAPDVRHQPPGDAHEQRWL
jgi:hypothetical protein